MLYFYAFNFCKNSAFHNVWFDSHWYIALYTNVLPIIYILYRWFCFSEIRTGGWVNVPNKCSLSSGNMTCLSFYVIGLLSYSTPQTTNTCHNTKRIYELRTDWSSNSSWRLDPSVVIKFTSFKLQIEETKSTVLLTIWLPTIAFILFIWTQTKAYSCLIVITTHLLLYMVSGCSFIFSK